MKIDLEVEEEVEIIIEQACEYVVWGVRNEEGTMIIKWRNKNAEPSQDAPKGCGKYIGETPDLNKPNHLHKCGEVCCRENKLILCPKCSKKSKSEINTRCNNHEGEGVKKDSNSNPHKESGVTFKFPSGNYEPTNEELGIKEAKSKESQIADVINKDYAKTKKEVTKNGR